MRLGGPGQRRCHAGSLAGWSAGGSKLGWIWKKALPPHEETPFSEP